MKLMNSDTHSWTVSLASFDIFAFAGSDFFMIRLTFAIGRKRSCSLDEKSETLPDNGLPTGLFWLFFPVMIEYRQCREVVEERFKLLEEFFGLAECYETRDGVRGGFKLTKEGIREQ